MTQLGADVIGCEPAQPRPRTRLILAALGLGALVGAAVGMGWSETRAGRGAAPVQVAKDQQGEGGMVTVCDGRAHAFVYARSLADEPTQVRLPVGAGGTLLPLMTDRAIVLNGSIPASLVGFLPEDGQLALVQELPVPPGTSVAAEVGDRALTLRVRGCGRGER